jgi:class 3 adenylate cyclase
MSSSHHLAGTASTETYNGRRIAAFQHSLGWHAYLDNVMQANRLFASSEDALRWLWRMMDDAAFDGRIQGPDQKSKTSHRGLRAVFVAEMVSAGGAGPVNSAGSLDAINDMRSIVDQQLQIHGGWLFGMPGDGVFALFESAVNAVRCALDTQHHLVLGGRAEERRLRIGIHLGEVVFENELPRGEALVIAGSLNALADPGCILISGSVKDAVSSRIVATFKERDVPPLMDRPRRIVTFAVTPQERTEAYEIAAGMSPLDLTTQFDPEILRSLRERQAAAKMGDRTAQKSNAATVPDESHAVQSGAVNGNIMPATREAAPLAKEQVNTQAPPGNPAPSKDFAPAAAQPTEEAGKPASQQPPSRRPGQIATPPARSTSTPAAKLNSLSAPDTQRPSDECVGALTTALSVHLGPLAKVLINRQLEDVSSTDHLVSLLDKEFQNNEERFRFRVQASHICKKYAYQQPEVA